MLFNSYAFIFAFLPVAIIGYFTLNHFKQITLGKMWLVGASLYFYSYFTYKNLPLLIGSILANYFIGHYLHTDIKGKKWLFKFGLVFNIGLLCFFKYAGLVGFAKIALPLGLSFFTLQQIGFLIDSYEGLAEEKNFLDYAVFVSFFPQLISGPIVHYQQMMPQIQNTENKRFHLDQFTLGIFVFCIGLVKKVLISEAFATWAKPGFDEAMSLDLLAAWKTSLSYTFQLYYDFSGYTDMAIGIGHMFNVKLPINFNSPFRSKSVIEFWTRWHMTLSQFINTYIFTPIIRAFSKPTFNVILFATFLAMFIAGIWHGAGWNFVVYGAIHGLALVVNHIRKKKKKKFAPWLAWLLTFNFVNISFVIFRAKDMSHAWKVLRGMMGLDGVVLPKIGIKSVGMLSDYGFKVGTYLYPNDYMMIMMFLGTAYVLYKLQNTAELEKSFKPQTKVAVACGIAFALCLFGMNRITEFIYFNF
jgi:alginate O-acetyltransferase complex protein AlgI